MRDKATNAVGLLVALAACYGAAALGRLLGAAATEGWYAGLTKPAWTPPGWLFGPVWTALYAMMAVAAWLVWLGRRRRPAAGPLAAFAAQLAFNAAWTPLFFGLHRPGIAFVDILLLWLALAVTVGLFFKRRVITGLLLLPYLLWVSFAAALNFAIWRMNV